MTLLLLYCDDYYRTMLSVRQRQRDLKKKKEKGRKRREREMFQLAIELLLFCAKRWLSFDGRFALDFDRLVTD